ncbi:MAG: hypothetical protein OHK0022_38190 [Roseiflexaceae bacterium]
MPDEQPSAPDHSPGENDRPDQEPPAAKPRARFRPPGRSRLSSFARLPPRRPPPLGSVSFDIRLNGPERGVIRLIELLSREVPVNLCIDPYITLPDSVWHQFPGDFLTETERNIVREDLRLNNTPEIARLLHLSTKTIIGYRSTIRTKFLGIPPALRPAWMDAWLRRYPGRRPDQPDQPGQPDQSDQQGEPEGDAE